MDEKIKQLEAALSQKDEELENMKENMRIMQEHIDRITPEQKDDTNLDRMSPKEEVETPDIAEKLEDTDTILEESEPED